MFLWNIANDAITESKNAPAKKRFALILVLYFPLLFPHFGSRIWGLTFLVVAQGVW
jgi:hypothetical protein